MNVNYLVNTLNKPRTDIVISASKVLSNDSISDVELTPN